MFKNHLNVEVADTPSKHEKGLMFRKKLEENKGMLFCFSYPQNLRFWGLNTYIPLSIAFVSPDNIIQKISYISPGDTSVVCSEKECDKAIETNYDFFQKNKIWVGDKIDVVKEGEKYFVKF